MYQIFVDMYAMQTTHDFLLDDLSFYIQLVESVQYQNVHKISLIFKSEYLE